MADSNFFIGIKLAFGAGDLESALSDIDYEHILSFEFKVLKKEDPFLQSMFSFLRNGDTSPYYKPLPSHGTKQAPLSEIFVSNQSNSPALLMQILGAKKSCL